MIERIPITDREQWLSLRKADVTASAVGALFGMHPYQSAYGLFQEKNGLDLDEPDSGVLRRGRLLEGVVALCVEEQHPEWKIEKATDYFRDPVVRVGCTPDFFAHSDPRGLGIIQAKTVAPSVFRNSWTDEGPPMWIALQAATEMMLTGATWGAVAALIVDPFKLDCMIYPIPKHDGVEQRIVDAVRQFWNDVEFGVEPKPDFKRDADLIASMFPTAVEFKTIDLSGDNYLPEILRERAEEKARIKRAEDRVKEIDAEIKFKIGDAEIATLADFTITNKVSHRKGYEVKPTSYRSLRITDHRPKEEIYGDGNF